MKNREIEVWVRQSGSTPEAEEVEVLQTDGGIVRQQLDKAGRIWRCQVLQFGMSLTRDIWPAGIFTDSLPMWQGVKAYADHPSESEIHERPERSIRDLVGWWSDFEVTDQGLDATLTIKPSADWLREDLLSAHEAGNDKFYGFSISARTMARQVNGPDGKPAREHTKVVRPVSIDVVTEAAANGHIKYALASNRARQGDGTMKKMLLAFLKADKKRFEIVRQSLVKAGAGGVTESMTEEQLADAIGENEALVTQAMTMVVPAAEGEGETERNGDGETGRQGEGETRTSQTRRDPANPQSEPRNPQSEPSAVGWNQLPAALREGYISQAFRDSELPAATIQAIRKQLGENATMEQVIGQIEISRAVLATVSQSGNVNNPGRVQVGVESRDKITIGLAKAFGLTRDQFVAFESGVEAETRQSAGRQRLKPEQSAWDDVPAVNFLKPLYIEMTGDRDLSGRSGWNRSERITRQAQTSWLTSDFTDMLSNLMHKRFIMSYRELDYAWRRVCVVKAVQDFKVQNAILLGYFGDLATVAENALYDTAAALTDDKETYSIAKRGVTVDLTLEAIANDDLRGFARIVDRLGRAAHRTLAKFIWNTCLFANPTMNADATAVFHANHNNLITDALATTGLKNAITKLLNQSEPGSSEKFAISTADLTLAVPPGLYLDAVTLTDFNQEPGGNQDPLAREIRRMGITPVSLPILSDANDWALFASSRDIDIVEVGFFNGNEEPEFFELSSETERKAFDNDVISRHKVRHIYGGVPVDFRGAVKSVVA